MQSLITSEGTPMRTTIIMAGMAINFALLIGIIYLNYVAPRPMQPTQAERDARSKNGALRKIALICPARAMVKNILNGFMETLENEAQFNYDLKIYDANSNRSLMRSNIEAAIEEQYDVLVPIGSQAAQMTKELTEKRQALIPVVFGGTGDPIKLELIADPDSSGNHLTGVSVVGNDWIDQMVDLIPVIAPHVKKVLIPYDPTGLGGALEQYHERFVKALEGHDYQVTSVQLFETNEIGDKVTPFIGDADMVLVLPDYVVVSGMEHVARLCQNHKKCVYVAQNLAMLKKGATFAFGYREEDIGIGVAHHVRRIIEHRQKPTDIPINRMESTYRVGVNIDNARAQGVLDKLDESILFLMEHGEVI